MGVWLVIKAQLSYARSRKITPNSAVTSHEKRLLRVCMGTSTGWNPTGYVALWRLDCRHRARASDPGRARGDRRRLLSDGRPCLRLRAAAGVSQPPIRGQPGHRGWSVERAFPWGIGRGARLDARPAIGLQPSF